MRTCFEIDENDQYIAARSLLVRRCAAWARRRAVPCRPELVQAALDARHYSVDGRLTFWTPVLVERYLLDWLPHQGIAGAEVLADAPAVLGTMLTFLSETGLRDPRGALLSTNLSTIAATADRYHAVLADGAPSEASGTERSRWSRNIDGRVQVDQAVMDNLSREGFRAAALGDERMPAQSPVTLPPHSLLVTTAAAAPAVRRLVAVWEWTGENGHPLDEAGLPTVAARRRLAARLRHVATDATPADVELYLDWAKRVRLIRRYRGRLVRVRLSAPLLDDPISLWTRALWSVSGLTDRLVTARTPLVPVFDGIVGDILPSLYSLPWPMPTSRIAETVWRVGCGDVLDIDALPSEERDTLHRSMSADLTGMWSLLSDLKAVEVTIGPVAPEWTADLTEDDGAMSPFDPDTTSRLLDEYADPTRLVALTPLATAVVRDRMLSEGREAALVGELARADAAEMLGVVTQHYPAEERRAEITGWLVANDRESEWLLDVVRTEPLRSRSAAMLAAIAEVDTAGVKLLRRMRSDPVLGPTALVSMLESGVLELIDLTDRERQLVTAESSLRLLEVEGPAVLIDGLGELPEPDARMVLHRILTSGHHDLQGMAEFRRLVAEPMSRRDVSRRRHPAPPRVRPERLGATRRARAARGGRS